MMIKKLFIKFKRVFSRFFGIGFKRFGKKSVIYKPLLISGKKYISIGKNVFVRNNARIEVIDKWKNQTFHPALLIGDGTSFEQNLHLTCAGRISIGKNCVFTGNIMISNIIHTYDFIEENILSNPLEVRDVKIGDYCFVGYGAQVLPGVEIGDNCIIGAGAIVTKNIPSFTMVAGNPAKPIKKYDFDKKEWIKIER